MRTKTLAQLYDEINCDVLNDVKDFIYSAERRIWEEYSKGGSWDNWWNNSEEKLLYEQVCKVIELHDHIGINIL